MASIKLYAELLVNIRQVTVYLTLPSPTNRSTTFELFRCSRALRVLHDNSEVELVLPCQVAENADLRQPAPGLTEISFRLQIAGELQRVKDDTTVQDQITVWPASDMASRTQIACRSCRNIIVRDTISTWKNLPSENWAEMMDFWHCHKPHVDNNAVDGQQKGSNKGYAASNTLTAQPSVGFVDTLHFLLTEGDCVGFEVSDIA